MSDPGKKAVFISYASQDTEAAQRLCDALRAAGVEVWFDQSELHGGDTWDQKIRRQIRECTLFVPVISANTNARLEGYFRREWRLAADRTHDMAEEKAFLLPVVIDGLKDGDALVPAEFRTVQWTRLPGGGTSEKFCMRVGMLLATEVVPVLTEPPRAAGSPKRRSENFWIAVLPFKCRGTGTEIASLADGMSEEIVTGLSRFSYLRVIANSSTARYAQETVDVRMAGRELGARYVMEGGLRQSGARLRVTVQLVDAATGAHVWAETYERAFSPDTLFELQDDLVPRIVGTVADTHGRLRRSMTETLRSMDQSQLTPYEVLLRSFGFYEMVTLEEHAEVRALLERAVEQAPGNADLWATLSVIYANEYNSGLNLLPDPLGRALVAARRAVAAGPTSELAYSALASVQYFRREIEGFRHAAERVVALNPLHSAHVGYMGSLLTYAGEAERGLALVARARQLNPQHPGWFWFADWHDAYRRGDYAAAVAAVINADMPGFFYTHLLLAASYAQLGQGDAAAKSLRDLLALQPNIVAGARFVLSPWFDAGFIENVIAGLRKAGLAIEGGGAS
jgi:TolB-like protein